MSPEEASNFRYYVKQLEELSNNPPANSNPTVEEGLALAQRLLHEAVEGLFRLTTKATPAWAIKDDYLLYMAVRWHGVEPMLLPASCDRCGSDDLALVNQSVTMPPEYACKHCGKVTLCIVEARGSDFAEGKSDG